MSLHQTTHALLVLMLTGMVVVSDNLVPPANKPGGRPVPTPPPGTSPPAKQAPRPTPTPTPTPVPTKPSVPAPVPPALPASPTPASIGTAADAPLRTPADGLAAVPLLIEPLGLRIRTPANCVMASEGSGTGATWTVTERQEVPRFILKISRLTAGGANPSPSSQIDEYIKAMTERPAEGESASVFSVRERKELKLGGLPAGVVYATIRDAEDISAVRGYLLIQTAPSEFIVVSVWMADEDFGTVAPLLDRSFGTIQVLPEQEIVAARFQRLSQGEQFLSHLDEDSLRTALDPVAKAGDLPAPRWYRLARTLADGTEVESGYLTISVVEAAQGVANPEQPESKWGPPEKEMGLLVRLRVRMLLDEKGTAVSDTEGRYWVRWDRQREFWTSRSTQRREKAARTSTQLGVRAAPTPHMPRPVLEIADSRPNEVSAVPRRLQVPGSAYLSLAEALVLPRLLAHEAAAGEYGFNWFDPRSDRPTQRRDVIKRVGDEFTLESQSTLEAPAVVQTLGARGVLKSQRSDDGAFTEAIDPNDLLRLWRQKGLPTG